MTEASERLEKLIDQLGNFENHETGELDIDDVKQDLNYIYSLLQDDAENTPPFAVGEYYSFTTYRIDYDADATFIFKTLETKNSGVRVIEYDIFGKELGEYVYDADSDFLKETKPATAEQIAMFKRAEQFAAKGRKLDEFRVGDLVNCKSLAYDNGYYIGDLVISRINKQGLTGRTDENIFYTYALPNFKKITLIQTAEELQEVGDHETI